MKKQILITILLLVVYVSNAQKIKVKEGKAKNLKAISEYNLEFDYSNLSIPKFDSEEEFLAEKMEMREKKEAGAGERFKKSWFRDREERYEPKFITSFNKRFKGGEVVVEKAMNNAKYTMKIHTTKLYAGYNVGVWRHNSEIDAIITIFETNNPSNIIFSGSYKDVQGRGAMGNDYDSGYRISECYAKLAKEFAKYIKKNTK